MLELQKKNNILILAAHPDDETLGCGATISKLSSEGHNIHLLTFTDGVGSRDNNLENRNTKLQEVSSILGINNFLSGTFPDNEMDSISMLTVCKFIDRSINFQPDIIFTHFIEDLNIDHQIVTKAALCVFRPQFGHKMKIYSYYVPSSTDYNSISHYNGNSYINVSDIDVTKKLNALAIYDTEMREYPHSRSYKNVENLMKVWGSEVGVEYCEKFKLIREVI